MILSLVKEPIPGNKLHVTKILEICRTMGLVWLDGFIMYLKIVSSPSLSMILDREMALGSRLQKHTLSKGQYVFSVGMVLDVLKTLGILLRNIGVLGWIIILNM